MIKTKNYKDKVKKALEVFDIFIKEYNNHTYPSYSQPSQPPPSVPIPAETINSRRKKSNIPALTPIPAEKEKIYLKKIKADKDLCTDKKGNDCFFYRNRHCYPKNSYIKYTDICMKENIIFIQIPKPKRGNKAMILTQEQIEEFRKVVNPIIEYLNKDIFHPHVKIIIDCTSAELVEGICSEYTDKYIKD
jgi:hypothetical protein